MKNKILKTITTITLLFFVVAPLNHTNIHAEESEKSIQYIPEAGGFLMNNVTVDEVLDSFEKNPNFRPVISSEKNSLLKTNGDYRQDYVLTTYVKGVLGENVAVNYTINMNMKTLKVNNKNYAQFVSIYLSPTYWLNSNSYDFTSSGTNSPNATILNGGATLKVEQTIQLQTTSTYSNNTGINFGWFSYGGSIGGSYYKRNSSKTYIASYNLPLIELVM